MKIIPASYKIETEINGTELLKQIESIGRTCYKSEDKITEDSSIKFTQNLIDKGHEAMLEHNAITVRFTCDRGVSHELVRHRLASFAQESTRYCNYSKDKFSNELTFIKPIFWEEKCHGYELWINAMRYAENLYKDMIKKGATPQEARTVLPNSLKTEIVMTMNLREWRHFFKLRVVAVAHPQMRELTIPLLEEFKTLMPVIFNI